MAISRESSSQDVIHFLKSKNLSELAADFEANQVDGEDFFALDMTDIYQMIPRFKLRKKFLTLWSEVTSQTQSESPEVNDTTYPESETSMLSRQSSHADQDLGTSFNTSSNLLCSSPEPESLSLLDDAESETTQSSQTNSSLQTNSKSSKCPAKKSLDFKGVTESPSACTLSATKSKKMSPHPLEPARDWLTQFCLPTRWEPTVQQGLRKGDLNPTEKSALVRQLVSSILAHTDSPSCHDRNHISLLLVEKYPFLKGTFGSGHQFWAKKIQERLLNLRRRSARNEKRKFLEEGIVIPKGKPGRKKTKIVSTLPSFPEGETEETLEEQRKQLVQMSNQGSQDLARIKVLMDNTFAKRRRDVLLNDTRVWMIVRDYPFLKNGKGVELKAELGRILEKPEIIKDMRGRWNLNKPKMLSALRKSQGKEIHSILATIEDCTAEDEKEAEDRCIMASLPYALGDRQTHQNNTGELFWDILDDDTVGQVEKKVVACTSPRLLSTGSLGQLHTLVLIAEGMVVAKFKRIGILNAVISLLAAYYTFNAQYPRGTTGHSKNVFVFFEHILISERKTAVPVNVEHFLAMMK